MDVAEQAQLILESDSLVRKKKVAERTAHNWPPMKARQAIPESAWNLRGRTPSRSKILRRLFWKKLVILRQVPIVLIGGVLAAQQ